MVLPKQEWRLLDGESTNRIRKAALSVLVIAGCCFWIPLVARMVAPRPAAGAAMSRRDSSIPALRRESMTSGILRSTQSPCFRDEPVDGSWEELESKLTEDTRDSAAGFGTENDSVRVIATPDAENPGLNCVGWRHDGESDHERRTSSQSL
jgi:hypothetical protein